MKKHNKYYVFILLTLTLCVSSGNAFEKGNYEILNFKSSLKRNKLTIEIDSEIGENFNPDTKEITLVLHNISKKPKKVKKFDSKWNAKKQTLEIKVPYNNNKQLIKIKL